MAQLPTPGGDDGQWGTILNEFLEVEHGADGTHQDASTTVKGVIELATNAEVSAGVDTARAVTAASLYTTQVLTPGASIAWSLTSGAMATVTLTENGALAAPTGMVNGASYILKVVQGVSGSHTLSFDSAYKFPDGVDPTLSTTEGAIDLIAFVSDGTNMYGSFLGNFS